MQSISFCGWQIKRTDQLPTKIKNAIFFNKIIFLSKNNPTCIYDNLSLTKQLKQRAE